MKIDSYYTTVLPAVSDQGAMHDRQGATRQALGTRGGAGRHAASTGPQARGDEDAKTNRRACLRNTEVLDGFDALPDEDALHVATEMSLHVLAYNLKRVMNMLGIAKTMKAMKLAGA